MVIWDRHASVNTGILLRDSSALSGISQTGIRVGQESMHFWRHPPSGADEVVGFWDADDGVIAVRVEGKDEGKGSCKLSKSDL